MDQLILPLLLALLFVAFLLPMRKQRRQLQQMQQLQSSLSAGDRVMTTSGMRATIVATAEDTIDLEIAPGVVTTWVRQAIRERLDDDQTDDAEATDSEATGEVAADDSERR